MDPPRDYPGHFRRVLNLEDPALFPFEDPGATDGRRITEEGWLAIANELLFITDRSGALECFIRKLLSTSEDVTNQLKSTRDIAASRGGEISQLSRYINDLTDRLGDKREHVLKLEERISARNKIIRRLVDENKQLRARVGVPENDPANGKLSKLVRKGVFDWCTFKKL
eukprot:g11958.t1